MKVRFCPSPTGVPHVGLLRTALYNWYHTKHNSGGFIFRLEDTDDARNTEESRTEIVKALAWLGITPDEGYTVDGDTVTFDTEYVQSARNAVYSDALDKLIAAGYVYKSYSSDRDIKARNFVNHRPVNQGYDNHDRNLTVEEIAKLEAKGVPFVYRFRLPDEDIVVNDLVRGSVVFHAENFVDFPVARGDGKFLYNFVNPVDDALMGVTDILRGEDLLPSTGKQVALWKALYAVGLTTVETPVYGHLPYIMGSDKKKLSKRDASSDFFHLVREGFIPSGLTNYLMLLGWGQSNNDLFSHEEFVTLFDVTKVSSNPAQFDMKKAMAINAEHIRMLDDETFGDILLAYLKDYSELDVVGKEDKVLALANVLKTRIQLLKEAVPYLRSTLTDYVPTKVDELDKANIVFVKSVIESIPEGQFTVSEVTERLSAAIAGGNGEFSNKTVFRPLGRLLSGEQRFLPPNDYMVAVGKDETLRLIDAAL
jgi:glutamyl-tRNA synthetase